MERKIFYRPVLMSAAVMGAMIFTGCGGAHQQSMKAQQFSAWNLTRIGILYQLADQQYKVGDYEKCTETLKDAFALKAQFSPIYVLAAKVQIEKSNLQEAAEYLNTAMRINANDPEPYYLLGVIYQRWQKSEVACDYYKQAWARKPDEARYMLAEVEMEISLGRLDEAQSTLKSKLVYFEDSAALRTALARIAILKGDFPGAAQYYREATTLMPDDVKLHRAFVESLYYAGQFKEAIPLLEDLRDQATADDRPDLLMMLGQSYMGVRRYQDGRDSFQEIIRDQPENTLAYLNLGKACIQTGDLGLALEASRKVMRNEPGNVEGMILTALVQQKQKKFSDAHETLMKAGRIAPTDTTVLCMLGVNAQQLGKTDEAIGCYQRAVQLNPKDAWAKELLHRVQPAAAATVVSEADIAEAPAAAMAQVQVPAGPKAP